MQKSTTIDLETVRGHFLVTCYESNGMIAMALVPKIGLGKGKVLVRIQSSCVFSESLGALDCDCSHQLHSSMEIVSRKGGLVIYVYEEGRGAGLMNKVEAIAIQQREQVDTAVAFRHLGLEPDLRDHQFAAQVLVEILGNEREIVLLTNDPRREQSLLDAGSRVVGRESLLAGIESPLVRKYLKMKATSLGHDILKF